MGRAVGGQDESSEAKPRLVRRINLSSAMALSGVAPVKIDYDVVEEMREAEKAYVEEVTARLKQDMAESARSEAGFARMLRLLARTPDVSSKNALWARQQIRYKADKGGYEPPSENGRLLPASTWEALGMRVKPEYLFTSEEAEHDPRFTAVMLRPIVFPETRNKLDAAGKPVMQNGKPVKERTGKTIFSGRFDLYPVYHEDAVEAADGSGRGLPKPSWFQATGSEEDALQLWQEVEKLAAWQKLKLQVEPGRVGDDETAVLEAQTVRVDGSAATAERATAALRCVAEAYLQKKRSPKDERDSKRLRALAASAEYAVASLFGLDTGRQAFPFLEEQLGAFKQENREKRATRFFDTVKEVTSDFIAYLDPNLRVRVQEQGRAVKQAETAPIAESLGRAAAFKRQAEAVR